MEKTKSAQLKNKWIILSIAFIILIIVIAIAVPKKNDQDTASAAPQFKKEGELIFLRKDDQPIIGIDIEIADNDSRREVGMMERPAMDELKGMLFVFDEEFYASFWMKNCVLSLDMIFINKTGLIVTIHKNTTPFSEQNYTATAPTLLVLEVNAGFTDRHNISVGDRITWKRVKQ
ncbi:MAG: DUF192 domain-containing protein [Bacteroidota bacterium]